MHLHPQLIQQLAAPVVAALVSPTAAAEEALNSTYVEFSLLALSSIFFLVDPFAAIPSFIAITSGIEPDRRHRMARKAALTCFIVLISFALAGQFIFSLFGIKPPPLRSPAASS